MQAAAQLIPSTSQHQSVTIAKPLLELALLTAAPAQLRPDHACACCAGGGAEYLVRASYLEIYNEEIRDLMGRNPEAKLELKESGDRGVYVRDLTQFVVKNVAEINSVLQVGGRLATVGWGVGARRGVQGCAMISSAQAVSAY